MYNMYSVNKLQMQGADGVHIVSGGTGEDGALESC